MHPRIGALMLLLAISGSAGAQTTGRIEGRVVGAEQDSLGGVRVTIESDQLQGRRTAQTDADGRFRLTSLPPGHYDVLFLQDGYNPVSIPGVKVSLDRSAMLETTMSRAFEEAMTVIAEAPIVDVSGTATGSIFPEEVFLEMPMSRTFEDLAFAAPGATDGGLDESNPAIRGSSAAENRYLIDGLDITDPNGGILTTSLAFEFVEEVEVKTGGYEAEYGGALGGILNVVTKSGGNELHGDLFGYFTNDDLLQSGSPNLEAYGRRLGLTEYDFGVDLGGKLIEDRLWYFVALNPSIREEELENRQGHVGTAPTDHPYYAGKLTGQLSAAHHLALSLFGESSDSENVHLNAAGWLFDESRSRSRSFSVVYSGMPTSGTLVELVAGRHAAEGRSTPGSEASPIYGDYSGTGSWAAREGCGDPTPLWGGFVDFAADCVGGIYWWRGKARRNQAKGSFTWFVGPHELKGGLEARDMSTRGDSRYPAPFSRPLVDAAGRIVDPDGVSGAVFALQPGNFLLVEQDGHPRGKTEELGLFLQDTWRINPRLTLNLGLRLDSLQASGAQSGDLPYRTLEFDLEDMVAPRVGVVWDLVGGGRSRLFASFARYFESVAMGTTAAAFSSVTTRGHGFTYPANGELPGYENLGFHLFSFQYGSGYAADPTTRPMFTDEVMVGFDRELQKDWAVGIHGVWRAIGDVVETISVDGFVTAFITNPGGTYSTNPVTGEALPEAVTFPEGRREYRALELTLDKHLEDGWQLFSSYVYSRLEGNYGGTFTRWTGQLGHDHWDFDTPDSMVGADGRLPNDRPHQLKTYGSYHWPIGLVTGFRGSYASGIPVNKLGWNGFCPVCRFVAPRGSAGRTPDVWSLDLHLGYPIPLGRGLQLSLLTDLFNITNEQVATGVDEVWSLALNEPLDPDECGGPGTGPGTDCPLGSSLWGTPTAYQSPRVVRLGLKLSW